MQNTPNSLSTFIRFLQLRSSRLRTQQEYVRWVTRLARHCGVTCASLLSQEEVLAFLHHLQQNHNYEGSTLNQCVCGLRLFFRDHLGRADWTCWSQIRIKRSVPLPTGKNARHLDHDLRSVWIKLHHGEAVKPNR